jgi:hypothetical protein
MILLDTDIMIDILRRFPPATLWLGSVDEQLAVPGFVAMELIQGCRNAPEQKEVERILVTHRTVWPDAETCRKSLELLSKYYLSNGLGIMDALIAQTAIGFDMVLHTFNAKHFSVIPGLKIAQPYIK